MTEYARPAASALPVNPELVGHALATVRVATEVTRIASQVPLSCGFNGLPYNITTSRSSGVARNDVSVFPLARLTGGSIRVAPDGAVHSTELPMPVTLSMAESVMSGRPYVATAAPRMSDTRTPAASRSSERTASISPAAE